MACFAVRMMLRPRTLHSISDAPDNISAVAAYIVSYMTTSEGISFFEVRKDGDTEWTIFRVVLMQLPFGFSGRYNVVTEEQAKKEIFLGGGHN